MQSAIGSRYSCNPQVKTLWPNHKTCEKTKKGSCVSGKRLNLYHNVREFDESLNYVVCSNIYKKYKGHCIRHKRIQELHSSRRSRRALGLDVLISDSSSSSGEDADIIPDTINKRRNKLDFLHDTLKGFKQKFYKSFRALKKEISLKE